MEFSHVYSELSFPQFICSNSHFSDMCSAIAIVLGLFFIFFSLIGTCTHSYVLTQVKVQIHAQFHSQYKLVKIKPHLICLFVFVALRPMSTAMVIAGRSVHLTTLFPGQA